jgi:dTDP-4-dehydrorhamnose reductase
VDGCELDPERAHRVNADAVGFLREACERAGAHLVHVSTDYVFSGEASEPYPEGHPTGPVNAYGVSKLAGEVAAGLEATVVRTAWLQSVDGANVFRSVLSQLAEPEEVFFVDDQHGSPTFVADLAPVILRLGVERAAGVVHATNAGTTSWYGFACEVARASGHDPERVHPICEDDLDASRSARRPAYSALDNAVLRDLGYEPMRHHRDAIADAVAGLRGEGA